MPRSLRDRLRNQFSRLEQGSLIVVEHEARFRKLATHATSIRGLRLSLRMSTQSLVTAGRSFV